MSNKYSLSLGRILGIQVFIHWTFLLLIAWTVYSDARDGLGATEMVWSVIFVLAIFVCVTLHEYGHALAARRYGIQTRDITLLPIGGLARLEAMPEKPMEELVVAIAGPLVNVAIVIILLPVIAFTQGMQGILSIESFSVVGQANFLILLAAVNLSLVIFNLIPAFPMDGGRIFRAILGFWLEHAKATKIAATVGQVLAVGFIAWGFYGSPFMILIGVFIFSSARSEAKYAQTRAILNKATLAQILIQPPAIIPAQASVKEAAQHLLAGQNKLFLVVNQGKPVGTLGRDQIIKAIAEQGDTASVEEAMDRDMLVLDVNLPIDEAWRQLQVRNKKLALVVSNKQLAGMVDEDNIAEFLMINRARANG